MAGKIRILWIEDNFDESIYDLMEVVKEEIESRLYGCEIIEAKNIMDAEKKMEENYIDIIVSDFNLDERSADLVTGLDYLVKLRGLKNYRYYILYSGNSQSSIVDEVTKKIKEKNKMNLFSNFNFFSRGDKPEEDLDEIIQHYLDERSKIEEIRNIYIIKNALIDDKLKYSSIEGNDYCQRINKYCNDKGIDSNIKSLWHEVRQMRNVFAHGEQKFQKNEWAIKLKYNKKPIYINDATYKDYLKKIYDLEKSINILQR